MTPSKVVFALEPESTATTSGILIGPPELLEELEELEELDELELLEELELLDDVDELELLVLELLDDELDELEDELVSTGAPPPQPVRVAQSTKASVGIAGLMGIIFIGHLMSLL